MRRKTEKQTRRNPAAKSRAQDALPPEPIEAPVATPPQEEPDEPMPMVDYIARAFPHCLCPRCKAGDPRCYKTRQYGARATLRYHQCHCGTKLKSMESW